MRLSNPNSEENKTFLPFIASLILQGLSNDSIACPNQEVREQSINQYKSLIQGACNNSMQTYSQTTIYCNPDIKTHPRGPYLNESKSLGGTTISLLCGLLFSS